MGVVLTILKIIGIILLVILGILVLLICLVLFNAVKYEVKGKSDGTMDSLAGQARFSWLFHLIQGEVLVRNDIFRWKIRVAWLQFEGPPESAETVEKEVVQEAEKVGEEAGEFVEEEAKEIGEELAEEPDRIKEKLQETEEKAETVAQEAYRDIEDTVDTVEDREDTEEQDREKSQESGEQSAAFEGEETHGPETQTGPVDSEEDHTERSPGIFRIIRDFIKAGLDTVREFLISIRVAFLALLDNIKQGEEAVSAVWDFLREEAHINAFRKIRDELLYLLKKLRPRLNSLKLKYGFDDPSLTGDVLAGLSVLYPFLGDNALIYPDFENQVFRINLDLIGKARIWNLLLAAIRLLLDKNVRKTYTDVMSMMNA